MKAKKDVKYIIKRILIGVGIALILANLKKCNVYADEINNYYLISQTDSGHSSLVSNNMYNNYFILDTFDLPYNNNYKLNLIQSNSWLGHYDYKYAIFYNQNLNIYFYMYVFDLFWSSSLDDCNNGIGCFDISKLNITFDENNNIIYNFYNNDTNNYQAIGGLTRSFMVSSPNVNLSSFTSSNINNISLNNNYNLSTTYTTELSFYINSNFLNNFTIYDTNMTNISFNGVEQEIPLPNGYSEIDISDYQAVYFIPKNYQTVSTHQVDNTTFIDFPFYYKGNINRGYFNIKDNNQVVFNPLTDTDNSESDFSFIEASFPMYYDERVSHDLSGYIIYNIGKETKVRYKSNEYNYYLVKDLSDYADEINYINDNGEEVSDYISFTKTLQQQWEQGFTNGGDSWVDNSYSNNGSGFDKIKSYLELAKLPFTFWKKMMSAVYSNTCEPLEVPMPMVSGTIRLQCLSTIFNNVLTVNVYNYFKKIVNIVYIILICLSNVKFLMINLSPRLDTEAIVDISEGGL